MPTPSLNIVADDGPSYPEPALDDVDLIEAVARRRDLEAFAMLFNRAAPKVKSLMMRRGVAPDLAEDLAIESLAGVWRKAHTFDPARESVAAWVFTIARDTWLEFAGR